jgi:hypothetical protein
MQLELFEKPEGIIYYHTSAMLYFRVYPPLCLVERKESQKSENRKIVNVDVRTPTLCKESNNKV